MLYRMGATQEQLAQKAQQRTLENTKFAGWMMGLVKDDSGEYNSNPLTDEEIVAIAASKKPYASLYRGAAERIQLVSWRRNND